MHIKVVVTVIVDENKQLQVNAFALMMKSQKQTFLSEIIVPHTVA